MGKGKAASQPLSLTAKTIAKHYIIITTTTTTNNNNNNMECTLHLSKAYILPSHTLPSRLFPLVRWETPATWFLLPQTPFLSLPSLHFGYHPPARVNPCTVGLCWLFHCDWIATPCRWPESSRNKGSIHEGVLSTCVYFLKYDPSLFSHCHSPSPCQRFWSRRPILMP